MKDYKIIKIVSLLEEVQVGIQFFEVTELIEIHMMDLLKALMDSNTICAYREPSTLAGLRGNSYIRFREINKKERWNEEIVKDFELVAPKEILTYLLDKFVLDFEMKEQDN